MGKSLPQNLSGKATCQHPLGCKAKAVRHERYCWNHRADEKPVKKAAVFSGWFDALCQPATLDVPYLDGAGRVVPSPSWRLSTIRG